MYSDRVQSHNEPKIFRKKGKPLLYIVELWKSQRKDFNCYLAL